MSKIWIRSQDKKQLILADCIYTSYLENPDGEVLANKEEYVLGNYKNHERAIEVLNDIQEFIADELTNRLNQSCIHEHDRTHWNRIFSVFQMPKE